MLLSAITVQVSRTYVRVDAHASKHNIWTIDFIIIWKPLNQFHVQSWIGSILYLSVLKTNPGGLEREFTSSMVSWCLYNSTYIYRHVGRGVSMLPGSPLPSHTGTLVTVLSSFLYLDLTGWCLHKMPEYIDFFAFTVVKSSLNIKIKH